MDSPLENRFSVPIIAGLMAFVAILSLLFFSQQSLRLDESQSLWQTSHTPAKVLNIIAQDVHVPLYHIILHYWQLFIGNSVFAGRMLSLVFFLLAIPAMYLLGKRSLSPNIGLFAAALLAISPFMNWYGNEIRMYSMMTLLAILSQYFFIGIYKTRNQDAWAGYLIVNILGIFTHYFFFFILIVQAVFYLMYQELFPKRSLRNFIFISFIIILAFAPWAAYVRTLDSVSNATPLLAIPTSVNVFNTFSQFLFGFQNDHLNTILVSFWPITVLLGFLALRRSKKASPEVIYMLLSILIPVAAAFIVSIAVKPLFVSRYLIFTIPSLYLFISWIFSTYPAGLRKSFTALLIIGMLIGLGVEAANPSSPVKEDYYGAAEYLEAMAAPQDIIIVSAPFTIYPVEYYYRGQAEISTLPIWNRLITGPIPAFDEASLPAEVETLKGSHERAFVLLSYDQSYEEKIRLYMDQNFERIDTKNFSPGLTLFVYRLRYDPRVLGR